MGTSESTKAHRRGLWEAERWRLPRLALVPLVFGLALAAMLSTSTPRAAAAPVQIAEAPPLAWGFKTSWRNYVPRPDVAGGAEVITEPGQIYNLKWAFESGTYDEETRTTQLDYKGSAHWLKYKASELGYEPPAGYTGEPDPYILDLTMSDPEVTISRDSAVVSAVVKSRDQRTWEIVDYGRVPLVNLEAVGVTPTTAGGTTSWSEIPAAVTEAGAAAFAGFYRVGAVVDPVSFSYTGPGGAPDFSEHFDEEGAPSLKLAQNSLFYEGDEPVEFAWHWLDEDHLVTHSFRNVVIDGQPEVEIQTFDLNQMQPLGEPVFIPRDEAPNVEGGVVAYDTSQDRLLYHGRSEEGITRWLSFDPQTGAPATGSIDDARLDEPGVLGEPGFENLAWDPTRDQGWRIEGDWNCLEGGDGDSAECQWQLLTFKEDPDGTWTKHSYPVPGFGPGQIEGGYKTQSNFTNPIYATASDGSLIVLAGAREGRDPGNPVPERVPVAYRLTLDEAAETVQAEPFPLTAPGEDWVSDEFFDWVKTAANGQILLINGGGPIARCQIVTAGGVDCDGRVNPNQSVEQVANSFDGVAVDPQDGTVWYRGRVTQKLAAFRDGAYLGGAAFKEITSRGGPILVGSDHTIYALTTDGAPAVFGGSKTWGWGKFELLGYVPTVTGQPADASVTLGAGEGSKAVTFTAAATGQPAPTRQWQVKTPGASRFTDLAGQTAETLQVNAEPSTNGSEYRAVFTNAAGRVAGDAAELAVEYAPRVTLDLGDASATAGHDAVFSVVADGNPEPTITWQRRVAGFWEDITGADDGFVDGGTTLTVTDTNTDQTGALFRAKITNPAGTVFSRTATLTVTPAAAIPSQGVDVTEASLDWLGNEEVQSAPPAGGSNYLSAGVSAGTEASYHSVVGNAAVYQVSAGQEALATYATRAAHISDGGSQLARLYSGHGHINADGSGAIAWQGAFSVNFYGGAVPFTIEDPEIHFAGDGTGYLSADLAGCTSSQANPDQCAPFAPRSEAIIATFRGVTVDPTGVLTIDPDYAGVEVQVSGGAVPQDRTAPGWGSWPQEFVDFQLETGLSSYWYSSGGSADPKKPPLPLAVDFQGGAPPASESHDEPPADTPSGGGDGGSAGTATPPAGAGPAGKGKPARIELPKAVRLDASGTATIATLACPPSAAKACEAIVPKRTAKRIAGKRYLLTLLAPAKIKPGRSAAVRVRLPKAARTALGAGRLTLRVPLVVRAGTELTKKVAKVTIVGRG